IAIVTHGGPVKVIIGQILKIPLADIWWLEQDLAALNIIEYIDGKPKAHILNDVSYLGKE
ncbi:histidine phosphatase family protein, partial [Candidatus Margulisiibacteriota bacterium]